MSVELARLADTLLAAGLPVTGAGGAQGAVTLFWAAGHPIGTEQADADAIVAGFDWAGADLAWLRAQAVAVFDGDGARLLRAIGSVLVDELNILRQRDRDRAADVAAATSLADLKTRWAARSTLADRTLAQAKQAIKDAANSAATD